ncbi:hypothetical protein LTR15_010851 [Elasticomyces elasticus]|nr:hypothetical protein LTR15_010851 [Elasticomyces elasticus]
MYDPDVFAVITAFDRWRLADSALRLEHNSRWFVKATKSIVLLPMLNSRETTPADDTPLCDEVLPDRLIVTFSELCALNGLEKGLQLSTSLNLSHILLGHRGTKGISGRQCNITVDDAHRIWLHDYDSEFGTAVEHNDQNGHEVRKKETWLLRFPCGAQDRFSFTTIRFRHFAIRIDFPNHDEQNPRYVQKLQEFVDKIKSAAQTSTVDSSVLSLSTAPSTQAPSEAVTPHERFIYYGVAEVGKGTFGRVTKTIRARDGKAFACKTFLPPPNPNKRQWDEPDPTWLMNIRREFVILRDNPHPNVIQVLELRESPRPAMIMRYYPLGNIANTSTQQDEYISAWGQILHGLSHLHAKGVVHRDLKPENILVERDPLFKVVIADFGLSKAATSDEMLRTFCGTPKYIAPEVFPGMSSGHGPLVDVWSLGIMVYEWLYSVLNPPNRSQPEGKTKNVSYSAWLDRWADLLAMKMAFEVHGDNDRIVIPILNHMLEADVHFRWPAIRCLKQGFGSSLFKRRMADGLVISAIHESAQQDTGVRTPTAPPLSSRWLLTTPAVTTVSEPMSVTLGCVPSAISTLPSAYKLRPSALACQ